MALATVRSNKPMAKRPKQRALPLTAAYVSAKEGGYTAEILEAASVYSQGGTIEETRENLYEVVALMLEEAPHQFGRRSASPPPGALLEKLFVMGKDGNRSVRAATGSGSISPILPILPIARNAALPVTACLRARLGDSTVTKAEA